MEIGPPRLLLLQLFSLADRGGDRARPRDRFLLGDRLAAEAVVVFADQLVQLIAQPAIGGSLPVSQAAAGSTPRRAPAWASVAVKCGRQKPPAAT